ncbi:MAG: hypothetical protein GW938_00080 [Leptospira sp.]|nr:hypothetical protein [Leptospira sp.]NCS94360.1 hypothetical protein [Leptospira sp.]
MSDRILDLTNIVNVLSYIDRFIKKKDRNKNDVLVNVSLPVREFLFWNNKEIKDKLQDLLYYFSDIHWQLVFTSDKNNSLNQHPKLPFIEENLEICFWSGGLDSYAGLMDRVKQFPEKKFVLASFEGNNHKKYNQNLLFEKIRLELPNVKERIFIHNTYENHDKNGYPYSRTRGLFFLLSGLSFAFLLGQKEIYMYENGVGALNLKLPGNYGLDQSITATFQSHRRCEEFFKLVSGEDIKIENPYAFETKSNMLSNIKNLQRTNEITITSSCDSSHRQKNKPRECGYCTSCILRRFSLHIAGIKDSKNYVEASLSNPELIHRKEFQAMYGQYKKIESLLSQGGLEALYKNDPDLYRAEEDSGFEQSLFKNKLRLFLNAYIQEWKLFESKFIIDKQDVERIRATA